MPRRQTSYTAKKNEKESKWTVHVLGYAMAQGKGSGGCPCCGKALSTLAPGIIQRWASVRMASTNSGASSEASSNTKRCAASIAATWWGWWLSVLHWIDLCVTIHTLWFNPTKHWEEKSEYLFHIIYSYTTNFSPLSFWGGEQISPHMQSMCNLLVDIDINLFIIKSTWFI